VAVVFTKYESNDNGAPKEAADTQDDSMRKPQTLLLTASDDRFGVASLDPSARRESTEYNGPRYDMHMFHLTELL
jgi:hypothetical protein